MEGYMACLVVVHDLISAVFEGIGVAFDLLEPYL